VFVCKVLLLTQIDTVCSLNRGSCRAVKGILLKTFWCS